MGSTQCPSLGVSQCISHKPSRGNAFACRLSQPPASADSHYTSSNLCAAASATVCAEHAADPLVLRVGIFSKACTCSAQNGRTHATEPAARPWSLQCAGRVSCTGCSRSLATVSKRMMLSFLSNGVTARSRTSSTSTSAASWCASFLVGSVASRAEETRRTVRAGIARTDATRAPKKRTSSRILPKKCSAEPETMRRAVEY
mmetsp:Transcript_19311/g.48317  ORF Transcript_19311/g.48317 Transcript_19311/m.48317 type:complete len:201 (+) Transcript_19311:361-963(+)